MYSPKFRRKLFVVIIAAIFLGVAITNCSSPLQLRKFARQRPVDSQTGTDNLFLECEDDSTVAFEDINVSWTSFSDYEMVHKIGEGEYAEVYKSIDRRDQKDCVVKKLKPPVDIYATKHEIDLLQTLRGGPNIVQFIGAATDTDRSSLGLVTEYVKGTAWKKLYPKLSNHDIQFYSFQLLRALEHAHARNIMHRDLKPDNVVIEHENHKLRLIDWGTSETLREGCSYDTRVTTRWWRAPEIVVEHPWYGLSADMWAFGCMLAALVFDTEPFFPGEDSVDQLVQIAKVLGTSNLFVWMDEYEIAMPSAFENITSWYPQADWQSFVNQKNKGRVSPDAIDLIDSILRYDPKTRLTATRALAHPYFDPVRHEAMTHVHSFAI